ncbi:MaoC/PaaZ C-terminal domain-containing protein [Streptomyces sp. WMMB 322]|uniref:MaoC family dehydratase n=1 Tax=Streptomyces sp. WMMB 322 TaxID=1286821 RepID=UPI0006E3A90A|nr:MaoC/PaaZ C-terminal domain-containing protein [Streptomyces sp. WMMB 322]SCK51105.1 MaoC like domain-containing protein [Streptomyces sp. WMMB 322]
MTVRRLTAPPRLPLVLARGALASRSKRGPYEQARLPGERLVLPDARIDAGRLRAYARVCGFDGGTGPGAQRPDEGPGTVSGGPPGGPQGGGPAGGSGTPAASPVPPTYPHILSFPLAMQLMARPDFPFPMLGLVHTGIELTQHRALRPEDRPEISVYAEGPAPHRRGSTFDVVTEARLGGRLVWHSRSTYLCRHRTADTSGEGPGSRGGTRRDDEAEAAAAPLPLREQWDLPSGLGRRYGRASGDRNPIHLHPLTAKLFGFPRHIAHGMWTFARSLAATGAAAGGEQLTARAEFKAPVPLPSAVTHHADEPTASAGGYRAPVRVHRFELRSGDGERQRLHLTGEVTSERP